MSEPMTELLSEQIEEKFKKVQSYIDSLMILIELYELLDREKRRVGGQSPLPEPDNDADVVVPDPSDDAPGNDDESGPVLSQPALEYKDCTNEEWCEYRYWDAQGIYRVYRIEEPEQLYYYKGCTTHRVLDSAGLVHIVPAISQGGCVRVYLPVDDEEPCLG